MVSSQQVEEVEEQDEERRERVDAAQREQADGEQRQRENEPALWLRFLQGLGLRVCRVGLINITTGRSCPPAPLIVTR